MAEGARLETFQLTPMVTPALAHGPYCLAWTQQLVKAAGGLLSWRWEVLSRPGIVCFMGHGSYRAHSLPASLLG